jgi:hypothetical protein
MLFLDLGQWAVFHIFFNDLFGFSEIKYRGVFAKA